MNRRAKKMRVASHMMATSELAASAKIINRISHTI